jgi:hypothetical protein
MYDLPLLHRQMLEILGIRDADKIVPIENDILPTDPVTENMKLVTGEPVKAFLYQDHEAHILTHTAGMEDPRIMEVMSKNPNAKTVIAATQAHIAEHLGFAYRQQIEKELGVPLPPPNEPLPEDIELRISQLVAPAAAQLTGKAQRMAAAEKNAEQQQDPVIQMKQKELQIKEQEAMAKAQAEMAKIQLDLQENNQKTALEIEKMNLQERIEQQKLQGKLASDMVKEQEIQSRELIEGAKIGIDMAQRIIDNSND